MNLDQVKELVEEQLTGIVKWLRQRNDPFSEGFFCPLPLRDVMKDHDTGDDAILPVANGCGVGRDPTALSRLVLDDHFLVFGGFTLQHSPRKRQILRWVWRHPIGTEGGPIPGMLGNFNLRQRNVTTPPDPKGCRVCEPDIHVRSICDQDPRRGLQECGFKDRLVPRRYFLGAFFLGDVVQNNGTTVGGAVLPAQQSDTHPCGEG